MREIWTQARAGSTASSAIIGLVAYSAMGLGGELARSPAAELPVPPIWTTNWNSPTSATTLISTEEAEPIHAALVRVFDRAASDQKALDPEIGKILADNLWDLYQA